MISKKRILITLTSLTAATVLGIGATLAYFTDKDEAVNTFNMGHVSGQILEDGEGDGKQGVEDLTFDNVVPGAKLVKIPYVVLNNESEDAYLRIKPEVVMLGEGNDNVPVIKVTDIIRWNAGKLGASWYYNESDGYYYYQKILSTEDGLNKSDPLFDFVKIPENWDNTMADKKFEIKLNADLIQAGNFTPEKNENSVITSWGTDVNIEAYTTK